MKCILKYINCYALLQFYIRKSLNIINLLFQLISSIVLSLRILSILYCLNDIIIAVQQENHS